MIEVELKEANALTEKLLSRQTEAPQVSMSSQYADVNNKLGLIYHERGEIQQAADFFKKAVAINPDYTEAALNLSITLNDLGQYNEARTILYKAASSVWATPNAVDPYIQKKIAGEHARLGDQYVELGLLNEGVEQYQKTLTLCPNFVDVVTKLGMILRTQEKHDEAMDQLMRARKINPSYIPAMIQLGLTYYEKGFLGLAYEQWKGASIINPTNKLVQAYLARLKMQIIME